MATANGQQPEIESEIRIMATSNGQLLLKLDGACSKDLIAAARMLYNANALLMNPPAPPEKTPKIAIAHELPPIVPMHR